MGNKKQRGAAPELGPVFLLELIALGFGIFLFFILLS